MPLSCEFATPELMTGSGGVDRDAAPFSLSDEDSDDSSDPVVHWLSESHEESVPDTRCGHVGCMHERDVYHEWKLDRPADRDPKLPDIYVAHYHPLWKNGRVLFYFADNSPATMDDRRAWAASLQVPTEHKTSEELHRSGYYEIHPGTVPCICAFVF